jgi:predicted sugar kinase
MKKNLGENYFKIVHVQITCTLVQKKLSYMYQTKIKYIIFFSSFKYTVYLLGT